MQDSHDPSHSDSHPPAGDRWDEGRVDPGRPGSDRPDRPPPHPEPEIHIVVEVDGKNKPVTFSQSPVTGREIREKAGTPLTDDLTRVVHGKPSGGNIGLDDKVEIRNGDHFIALPTGTVS